MLNHYVALFKTRESNLRAKGSFELLHHYTTSTKVNKKHTVQLPMGREREKMSVYANDSGGKRKM